MQKILKTVTFGLILSCAASIAAKSAAADAGPAVMIKDAIEQIRDVVKKEEGKTDADTLDQKLRGILMPVFDFGEMSRRSLGSHWGKAKPEEQQEFVKLFSDLLAYTYLKRIRRNATTSEIKEITDTITGDKAFVKSVVVAEGDPVSIDYRLMQENGGWRIYDVVIENIGLVSNYRDEFNGIIRKEGMPGLLTKLREKQVGKSAPAAAAK